MTLSQASLEEWRTVFWVTFVIYVVTTFGFCIGASGEIQLWNYPKEWKEPECNGIHETECDGKDESSENKSI